MSIQILAILEGSVIYQAHTLSNGAQVPSSGPMRSKKNVIAATELHHYSEKDIIYQKILISVVGAFARLG